MGKDKVIYGQDKNYSSKLTEPVIKSVTNKFKEKHDNHYYDNRDFAGFELNGGEGLTKGGQKEWNDFEEWCENRGIRAIYNTNSEVDIIKDTLRNRVDNKNKS